MDPSLQALSDEALAARSQDGSLSAFEELVCRYEARVFAFIARCCQNEQVARDVTQDTFVRAFQALDLYQPSKAFAPWLFTIARRKWIDHYRAAPPVAEGAAVELVDQNDPAELLAREEERLDLWRVARRRLTSGQFQALWLRYVEELELEEIARVMGKTKTGIKVHLFRARQTLGRFLLEGGSTKKPAGPAAASKASATKTAANISLQVPGPPAVALDLN